MEKKLTSQPKKYDAKGVKQFIFVLAVSTTLGFWGVLSRLHLDQTTHANQNSLSSGSVPPLNMENQLVLILPSLAHPGADL